MKYKLKKFLDTPFIDRLPQTLFRRPEVIRRLIASLLLVSISVMATSMVARAVEITPGDGRIVYSDGAKVSQGLYTGGALGSFASISASTIAPTTPNQATSPVKNERLVTNRSSITLEMLRFDGTTWTLDWTENIVNWADVAYENSGEALIVWSQFGGALGSVIEYRVWDGTDWSASAAYDLARTTDGLSRVWTESHPASGSNQNDIAVCYSTVATTTEVGCVIWDGDSNTFNAEPSTILESDAEENSSGAGTNDPFDLFYEQSSTDLVVVISPEAAGGTFVTATFASPSWTATSSFAWSDNAEMVSCSAMPTVGTTAKNKAVCVNHGNSVNDCNAIIWDGSAFGNAALLDGNCATAGNGRRGATGMWLTDGTDRVAVVAWASGDTGDLDWNRFDDAAGTWLGAQSFSHTTGTDSTYISVANPYEKSEGLIFLTEANADVFGYKMTLAGTTVTPATLNSGNAITKDSGFASSPAHRFTFDVATQLDQFHYIWRNDDGDLTAASNISAEDTPASGSEALPTDGTIKRLRFLISNEGAASSSEDTWRLEMVKSGTSCTTPATGWSWATVPLTATTASHAFDIQTTDNITDGASTSHYSSLTAEDPTFTPGYAIDARTDTGKQTLGGNNYTEIEFALKGNSNAQSGATYCFRLTRAGSTTLVTYDTYAKASISVATTTFSQSGFRFFNNISYQQVGYPLADLNASASMPNQRGEFRLRTLLHIATANLGVSGASFKLQYAQKSGGSCAGSTYAEVTTSTPISYLDNGGTDDGIALFTNYYDPTHGSDVVVPQTYEEANNLTNSQGAVTTGQDAMFDFALKENGANPNTAYCLRIVRSDDTTITYNVYPEITTWDTTIGGVNVIFQGGGASAEIGSSGGTAVNNSGGSGVVVQGPGTGSSDGDSGGGTVVGGGGDQSGGGGAAPGLYELLWLILTVFM